MFPLLAIAVLTCGTERWDVKTLTDKGSDKLSLKVQVESDVLVLREEKVPFTSWSNTLPRFDSEKQVAATNAWVTAFKVEDDGDVHIVLGSIDDKKKTMVAEIPDPACMKGSPAKDLVVKARADFQKLFGPLPKTIGKLHILKKPVQVRVSGFVFFDKLHGQTGVAPNGVELHPVLGLNVPSGT